MKLFNWILTAVLLLFTSTIFAQGELSGTIMDGDLNAPLGGANIMVKGSSIGTTSDFDGKFKLNVNSSSGTIVVSYLGFVTKEVNFTSTGNIGTITLEPSAEMLESIVITGTGVIDLAEDRKTPIAVSTIKAREIEDKVGNQDLPEILKSTPSVQNIKGGGFGDGRMFLRGFDQTNTAFLLNGQPINGMEDGKMYWSNWSGVLDIANAVQVQRGLGSSKLAISSVGGTVNIVTKTVDKKEGGYVKTMVGNDDYIKTSAYYSTGLLDNGFAFSGMFGHWQGDGYVNATNGQGQTYFLSFGYKPNEKHLFNFILTGAPQWHASAGRGTLRDFRENGRKYNSWNFANVNSGNTVEGGLYPGGRNIYHKPVANLTWDWAINDKSSLSTVLYGSIGRGAFASVRTNNGAPAYARGSYNNHNWFGLVTNYNRQLGENFNLNVGADARYYNGEHFRGVTEFLSTNSVAANNTFSGSFNVTNEYGGINPWGMVFNPNNSHTERLAYDYEEVISYYGVFGQLEYSKNNLSAFFQGAISNQSHVKTDYWNYATEQDSDDVSNVGYNLKAGAAYTINDNHKVFANTGYYSRQPFHDDLFTSVRTSNDLIEPAVDNQDIIGFELGYQFKLGNLSANINGYHTIWDNRTILSDNGLNVEDPGYLSYQLSQVSQVHQGVEVDVNYALLNNKLKLSGFWSAGSWEYKDDAVIRSYDIDGALISTAQTVNIDGAKVGGAAQVTAGLGFDYKILNNLSIDSNWNWYNDLHSDITPDPEDALDPNYVFKPISLLSYNTVDAGLSFKHVVNKENNNTLHFRVNVYNVFDEVYIESSSTAIEATTTSDNYNGVNLDNRVRMGYGRTWNFSVKYSF